MIKSRLLLLLMVLSLCWMAVFCQTCLGGEGKIILKPRIDVSWQMDSNFWWAETDGKEVFTYLVQPGITFGYETDKSQIQLDYSMNGYMYDDRDSPSPGVRKASDDNYLGHTLKLLASTRQLRERLFAGIREDFYLTRDPGQSDIYSDSVQREKYFINRVEPFGFYELSDRFTAGLRYRNTITDYTESYMEDSTENRGLMDLVYNISEISSLDLDYQIWTRDYSKKTSDYLSNQVMLAFRQQFSIVYWEVAAGYQYRSFDDDNLDSIDVIPWNLKIELSTDPTPISPLLPTKKKKSFVSLMASQDFNNQGLRESYFRANRVTLEAGHVFFERFPVYFYGYYQNSDYEFWRGITPSGSVALRDDDTYKANLSVGYRFLRWFTLSVTPGYEKRNSNIAGRSYEDKTIMAQLAFEYDVGGR